MLIDARRDPPSSTHRCDVCIVGAGPAGITLARELDDGRREICLLESGGHSFEAATQSQLAAAHGSDDYPPLQATRVGALGGSSQVWAGWCRPLDDIDFQRRPDIPSSGWPISRAELDPFYLQAHAALRLGPFTYDPIAWERSSGCQALQLAGTGMQPILFRKSNVNFGREHVAALRRSQQIRAWLHSTALRVRYSPDALRVLSIEVGVTGRRRTFDVLPRLVVLAAGGIENARLLLLSAAPEHPSPLDLRGVVGRYFTEHCYVDGGWFEPSENSPSAFCFRHMAADGGHVARGAYARRRKRCFNALCSIAASLSGLPTSPIPHSMTAPYARFLKCGTCVATAPCPTGSLTN